MKKDLSPIVYPKKLPNTKAWKLTSEYVRLLANGRCYTCGRSVPFKKLSAGHFIEKLGCAAIYFELAGLRGQCYYCNRLLHGNKAVYAIKLLDELGADGLKTLYKLSRKPKFWRKNELEKIAAEREKDIQAVREMLDIQGEKAPKKSKKGYPQISLLSTNDCLIIEDMEKGYELKLIFWTFWECKKCAAEQDAIDDEEWPTHCGEMMEMRMKRQFRAVKKEENKKNI